MGAGQPDWNKLNAMGKLPVGARGKIPLLAQLDTAEVLIEKIKKGCCVACKVRFFPNEKSSPKEEDVSNVQGDVSVKCGEDGCDHVASGRTQAMAENYLRLHMKTHKPIE